METDGAVAELAGVSVGTVRNVRRELGISGARRKRKAPQTRSRATPKPEDKRARTATTAAAERLKPHMHLLGVESDPEIARRANVHPNTVRSYRIKRGIPAAPRTHRPSSAEAYSPAVKRPTTTTQPVRWLWKVVHGPGLEGFVVATDVLEAARKAERAGVLSVASIERGERML